MNVPGQLDIVGGEVPGKKDFYDRILLAGDTHGNYRQIMYLYEIAKVQKAHVIFQLGDFGYWTHTADGKYFLEEVSHLAEINGIPFYWLDGNHENHAELRRFPHDEDADDFWEVAPSVYYAPRGHRWEWRGIRFMALGGAFSIDRAYRRIGSSWWWEEEIDADELDYACRPGEVDVMLTHDMPGGVDFNKHCVMQGRDWFRRYPESEANQNKVRTAMEAVQPDVLFHGHMHMMYRDVINLDSGKECKVQGLNCDDTFNESWEILDLS
jgi:predicted phosphodiesterase